VLSLTRCCWIAAVACLLASAAGAEAWEFTLDPERSDVKMSLGATLHTVPGEVPIESGRIRYDAEAGTASGRVVIQAGLLDTGIDARNEKMHELVLVSAEHPEIVFEARGFELRQKSDDEMRFVLRGDLTLVGATHALELETHAVRKPDGRWRARAKVTIPYVEWGLVDPSMFLFSVEKYVTLEVKAVGPVERVR